MTADDINSSLDIQMIKNRNNRVRNNNVVGGDLMTAGRPVIVARYRHAFSVFRWGNDADDAVVVPIEIALLNGHDPFIDIGIDVRHLCYIVVHTEFVLEVEGEGAFYRSVLLLVRA